MATRLQIDITFVIAKSRFHSVVGVLVNSSVDRGLPPLSAVARTFLKSLYRFTDERSRQLHGMTALAI